jgi:hypothetical protein
VYFGLIALTVWIGGKKKINYLFVRTNAFMTKLFFAVVENILNNLGFDIK